MIWLILFACLSLSWLLRDTKNVAWTLRLHIPNSMRWIRAVMTPFYWCMKMNWAHMALIHKVLHTTCLLQQSQKHVLNLEYFKNYAGVLSISKSLKWIPFSHAFEVAYLPFLMPNSFSSMDSASQSDFHTWFSCLHIGLCGHLRYQDTHTEPAEMTCEWFAAFWLAVAAQPGNYGPSQMTLETYSYRAALHLYCLELIMKLWRPPTLVHPPENEGPWFMKSSMLSDVLLLLVTDTGMYPVESQSFFILQFTGMFS